jgi:hypothetical protein
MRSGQRDIDFISLMGPKTGPPMCSVCHTCSKNRKTRNTAMYKRRYMYIYRERETESCDMGKRLYIRSKMR